MNTTFDNNEDNEEYVKKGFWSKVKTTAAKVPFVLDTVGLYYVLIDQKTPLWAKGTVAGALAYFISPVDAIPDTLVGLGYTDDAAIVAGAITALGENLNEDHKKQAKEAMDLA